MWLKRAVLVTLAVTVVGMLVILTAGIGFSRFDQNSTASGIVQKTKAGTGGSSTTSADSVGTSVTDPVTGEVTIVPANPDSTSTDASSTSSSGDSTASGGTSAVAATPSGGTASTPTAAKPVVTISISPGSISAGASATVNWSATNSPTSCTASNSWSGTKSSSGSQSTGAKPTAGSFTYTLACANAGGSSSASATLTVNAAALACGAGGTCQLGDIQGHNTQSDCRSAINKNGGGLAAYAPSSSFLSAHSPYKSTNSVVNLLCGKVYSSNLRNVTGDHRGPSISGANYDTWMTNFYIGPYQ